MGDQTLGEVANHLAIAEMHIRSSIRKLAHRRDAEAENLLRVSRELRLIHTRLFTREVTQRYKPLEEDKR